MLCADIRSADLRPLGEYLVDAIESELRAEQLPIDTFSALTPDSVLLAKTASRRMLGFKTEMAAELGYAIPNAVCPRATSVSSALHNRDGYVMSIELVEAMLAARA